MIRLSLFQAGGNNRFQQEHSHHARSMSMSISISSGGRSRSRLIVVIRQVVRLEVIHVKRPHQSLGFVDVISPCTIKDNNPGSNGRLDALGFDSNTNQERIEGLREKRDRLTQRAET
jgi:hypothetical protein